MNETQKNRRHGISFEAILGETEGLRRLASRLVGDAASADDLVQEAVLAALSSGPAVRDNPGGWLRSTVRNLARQGYRTRAGRAAREAEVAPKEATASTSESVIAAERQRVLLESVMGLEEPYREVVLARFIRGLSPRAIAEESGTPVPTVKKQIERGLGQLRSCLGDRFGGGGAWAVALLPLCREDVRALALKGSAVGAAAKIGSKFSGGALLGGFAALMVASAIVAAWYAGQDHPLQEPISVVQVESERALAEPIPAPEQPTSDAPSLRVLSSVEGGLEHQVEFPVGQNAVEGVTQNTLRHSITLLGLDGEPMRNASVEWRSPESLDAGVPQEAKRKEGRTDEEGRLNSSQRWETELGEGTWTINGREFAPMGARSPADTDRDVLMAPAVRLAGYVKDSEGAPVSGANVRCNAQPAVSLSLGESVRLGGFYGDQCGTVSGVDGSFDLGFVPGAGMAIVRASADHLADARPRETPTSSDLGMVLVVRKRETPKVTLTGRVEFESGRACAGALVRFDTKYAEADRDGRFTIGIPYLWEEDSPLISAQDGAGHFGIVEGAELRAALKEDAPELRIVVPKLMASLSGTLLHPDGEPARRVRMVLMDGTSQGGSTGSLEQIGLAFGQSTDHEGRFELSLLRDRPYRVRFFKLDPLILHDVTIDPAEPGPLTITLPEEPKTRAVAGVVVDQVGEPVEGAHVHVSVVTYSSASKGSASGVVGLKAETDKDGAFQFPELPSYGLTLGVSTQSRSNSVDASTLVEEFDETKPTRIVIDPLCEVRLSIADPTVTSVGARNGDGEDLLAHSKVAGGSTTSWSIKRGQGGEFPLLFLPQSTVALSLRAGHKELRSEPVRFERGKLNRIDL